LLAIKQKREKIDTDRESKKKERKETSLLEKENNCKEKEERLIDINMISSIVLDLSSCSIANSSQETSKTR
jgi:hypothetical protein